MRRLATGTALLLVIAACTDEASDPEVGPTVLSVAADVPELTVEEDYGIVGDVVTELDGRAASFGGWTADGTEIYVRDAHTAGAGVEDYDPRAVALVARDPESGRTTVLSDRARRQKALSIGRLPGNALQILAVRVAGDVVAWVETPSSTSGDLFVLDTTTGEERRLVRGSVSAAGSTPVVLDDHVYFIGIDGDDLDATPAQTSLRRVPVDGSAQPELVAPEAVDVHLDGKQLVVAMRDRVVRWDPSRGTDGEVADSAVETDCGSAAGERVLVVCDGRDLLITSGDERIEVESVPGHVGYLWANSGWVAFTSDVNGQQTQYLVDLGRQQVRRVPNGHVLRGLHTEASFLGVLGSERRDATEPVIELTR